MSADITQTRGHRSQGGGMEGTRKAQVAPCKLVHSGGVYALMSNSDANALAVHNDLWEDEEFIASVYSRAIEMAVCADGGASGIPTQERYVRAIAAELRARAGGEG